jgi:hypothetical protein
MGFTGLFALIGESMHIRNCSSTAWQPVEFQPADAQHAAQKVSQALLIAWELEARVLRGLGP